MQFKDYLTPKNISNWCSILNGIRSSEYFDPIKFDSVVTRAEIFLLYRKDDDILAITDPLHFTVDDQCHFNGLRSIFPLFYYNNYAGSKNRFCEYIATALADDTIHQVKKAWINLYDTFFFTEEFAGLKKDYQDEYIKGFLFIRDFLELLSEPAPDYGQLVGEATQKELADKSQITIEVDEGIQGRKQIEDRQWIEDLKSCLTTKEDLMTGVVKRFLARWVNVQLQFSIPLEDAIQSFLEKFEIEHLVTFEEVYQVYDDE